MAKLTIWDERMLLLMRHCIDKELVNSQKEFLSAIGFSETNLRQVKLGSQSFRIEHFVAAAKKYKINTNWFFGLEENMKRLNGKSALEVLKDAVRAIEADYKRG